MKLTIFVCLVCWRVAIAQNTTDAGIDCDRRSVSLNAWPNSICFCAYSDKYRVDSRHPGAAHQSHRARRPEHDRPVRSEWPSAIPPQQPTIEKLSPLLRRPYWKSLHLPTKRRASMRRQRSKYRRTIPAEISPPQISKVSLSYFCFYFCWAFFLCVRICCRFHSISAMLIYFFLLLT